MDNSWQLAIHPGNDVLRAERLTRELHRELGTVDGLNVGFVQYDRQSGPQHKGVDPGQVSLNVTLIGATAQVMVAAIKGWCERDRHRKVEVSRNGVSVVITGTPTETQEQIVRLLAQQRDNTTNDPGIETP